MPSDQGIIHACTIDGDGKGTVLTGAAISDTIKDDALASGLADRMNKNMYMLSVIAAIFLPLGFLTGLLGINVGGIPGAENGDAFWTFIVILIGVIMVQIAVFKKLKWF